MSTNQNSNLGYDFFAAQDRLRGGPDPDLCASNYIAKVGGNPPMTLAAHQDFANAFYGGFPDLCHIFDETFASDNKVTVRFRLRGTHQGEFMGIPPTQKRIEVGAIAVFSITDGKISEIHGQFDQLGMMQQLGVIPTPEAM